MRVLNDAEISAVAGGAKQRGFVYTSGQGNLDNRNSANSPNSGTTTESGPRGVLKNENYDNPNYDLDLPGAKR